MKGAENFSETMKILIVRSGAALDRLCPRRRKQESDHEGKESEL
jgi:hypothetical protein